MEVTLQLMNDSIRPLDPGLPTPLEFAGAQGDSTLNYWGLEGPNLKNYILQGDLGFRINLLRSQR
jgi:hypothetical protein